MGNQLRPATNHRVGIWIDHTKAVIVSSSAGADRVTVNTLQSATTPRAGYAGRATHPTLDGPWDGGETAYEERHAQHLERYYDEIITQLGHPAALLIFGPGAAKLEFNKRLSRFATLARRVVGLEAADTLTDLQIVAKVKQHYGIDH